MLCLRLIRIYVAYRVTTGDIFNKSEGDFQWYFLGEPVTGKLTPKYVLPANFICQTPLLVKLRTLSLEFPPAQQGITIRLAPTVGV